MDKTLQSADAEDLICPLVKPVRFCIMARSVWQWIVFFALLINGSPVIWTEAIRVYMLNRAAVRCILQFGKFLYNLSCLNRVTSGEWV